MGRKAYAVDATEREKGEMKRVLWHWGQVAEKFNWKEEELKKLQESYCRKRKIWEESGTEESERELEQMEQEHLQQAGKLRREMVELIQEKSVYDDRIRRLPQDEQYFVRMRFEKGFNMDYIGVKMHLSRATVYRVQNRAIGKLLLMKQEEEN